MDGTHVIGDYHDIGRETKSLKLSIWLPIGEIISQWSRCGLLANFAGTYLSVGWTARTNIANSLSFIINELLENAAKYSSPNDGKIEMALLERDSVITIDVTNAVKNERLPALAELAKQMTDNDFVNAKYIEMMIANAGARNTGKSSGIGLLTVINYFKADMSFRIVEAGTGEAESAFSVQVRIDCGEL